MTAYSHTITLNDGQRIALEAALTLMIEHCDEQMKVGPKTPYFAHQKSCQEIWSMLITTTPQITSTNTSSGRPGAG